MFTWTGSASAISARVVLRDRQMLSRTAIVVVIIAIDRQTGKLGGAAGYRLARLCRPAGIHRNAGEKPGHGRPGAGPQRRASAEWSFVNAKVRDTLYKYYYEQTKRRPMILPFMVKV